MAMTKQERLALIHEEAMREFDKIQTAMRDERLQCLQDRRFYSVAGAQWEGPLGVQFENKPRFEFNKIHLSVIRIFNEYRNNRIDVEFISKDGEDKDNLADTCSKLYRADEQDSCAEEAYDNAFEEAVGGGFGAWRLRAEYEDEYEQDDDEEQHQRVRIEPIFDADSCVFFDLNAKRQDKSDAKRCFVLTSMTRDAYRLEYDEDPSSWPKQIHQRMFDWLTPDVVYLAEMYVCEKKKETVHVYESLTGEIRNVKESELKENEELIAELEATGFKEIRTKKIQTRKVHKYLMDGMRVIEDYGYIAGKHIPIVPVYGKRWFVDNVERCMGHVRLAKDSQRLKNMQLSKLGEYAAVSAISKPIFTPEQIAGHQLMWADDNNKNYPYLLINQLTDANGNPMQIGPASYTQAPDVPPAMAALLQLTEADMKDILGNQQMGEQIQANLSGKAVELVQSKIDMQSFIYISNFAKAIKRSAEIWLSMAKDVMVEEGRKVKGIGAQGEVESIELMKPVISQNGEVEHENDLSEAEFDIAIQIGPTSTSKRQATVRSLTNMMAITQDQETQQVLTAMTMMNMEGEGVGEVRDYFRKKLLRMGVVQPTEEEAQQLAAEAAQSNQPDAQSLYLMEAAKQAEAEAGRAEADTLLKAANVRKTEAQTMEILSNIQSAQGEDIFQRFPDWNEVMNSQAMVTPEMEQSIRSHADPEGITYILAKNPQLADQIAALPQGQQSLAISQLAGA